MFVDTYHIEPKESLYQEVLGVSSSDDEELFTYCDTCTNIEPEQTQALSSCEKSVDDTSKSALVCESSSEQQCEENLEENKFVVNAIEFESSSENLVGLSINIP